MNTRTKATLLLPLVAALGSAPDAEAQDATEPRSFESAASTVRRQLEESMAELDRLRDEMAQDILPLSRRLSELEQELSDVRLEHQDVSRQLDRRLLNISNLRRDIELRREDATYLSNLLAEYIRNFESRIHIAELDRYGEALERARLAPESNNLSQREIYATQVELLDISLERLQEALGGARFAGTAIDGGLVKSGKFVLVGPNAVFRAEDGSVVGPAERLESLEPTVLPFEDPLDTAAAAELVTRGEGFLPLDPTLGNAQKIASTEETLVEHVRKGGPVMVPIFAMAAAALLVALYKWLTMLFVRRPSQRKVRALLQAVAAHDRAAAGKQAKAIGGPTGRMLASGVEHLGEPRELIEEIMYETVLTTRLKLQRLLPFIAICAASAPLLGLLGTVTGIINTFKLITVFGSGDVKMLSGGISEALITTEFGLIVAIPSLLLHAFLSRRARGVVDQMEKAAVAFVNQVGKTPWGREAREVETPAEAARVPAPEPQTSAAVRSVGPEATAEQVRATLLDMLAPVVGSANAAARVTNPTGRSPGAPGTTPAVERRERRAVGVALRAGDESHTESDEG